jgi:hypothetical protein
MKSVTLAFDCLIGGGSTFDDLMILCDFGFGESLLLLVCVQKGLCTIAQHSVLSIPATLCVALYFAKVVALFALSVFSAL